MTDEKSTKEPVDAGERPSAGGELQNKQQSSVASAPKDDQEKDELEQDTPAKATQAYSMRPAFGEMFPLPIVKSIINTVMAEKLKDKTYDKDTAATWTREIADEVNLQIAASSKVKRYKHVVQVMLGQELGAGTFYTSRCCWDCDCDTSVSEVFSNTSLFCVCTVFGTYQY
ncbi:tctex1 domain-containing protein 2 [Scaptodrosophila lebanonensis]|uniref:Tctex1 domain-containing protein 2 n=1 Tax=Drosophila lebanonensis TaxID=7225 RepID=A0A6J2TK63_DROLE|nr:tctex1 domain-containing protein 2 [Scaptodrosophila lebanonensis]